jgi:hypothetical protein
MDFKNRKVIEQGPIQTQPPKSLAITEKTRCITNRDSYLNYIFLIMIKYKYRTMRL